MSDRRELIREFKEWREAEGLPFDPRLVPRRFDGIKDLEDRYWQAEQDAKREAEAAHRSDPPRPPDFVKEGIEYQARSIVAYDGSMWHANETTRSRPGRTGAWTLCVKRGRDGRDNRKE
jgi:hypothetical protein